MIAKVINLQPEGERWNGFTASAQAVGLSFTRFPAIDTRSTTPETIESRQVRLLPGTLKAMVGCTLSHLALWQECAAGDEPMLILEDDARFVEGVWDADMVAAIDPDIDLVVLQTTYAPELEVGAGPLVQIRGSYRFSTAAYRITPQGASALLTYCRRPWIEEVGEVPTHEYDGVTSFYRVPFIVDRFIRQVAITRDVKAQMLIPNPVAHAGLESTITESDFLVPPPKREQNHEIDFASRKRETLRSLTRLANKRLSEGIEVSGITLAAESKDQEAFTRLLILLREAFELQTNAAAKADFLNTPQIITDIHGKPHTLPGVRALRRLLVSYGATLRELWSSQATRRARIAETESHDELDAVLASD